MHYTCAAHLSKRIQPSPPLPSLPFLSRECRLQLEELQSSQKAQVLQAERTLEDYRVQSEASTNAMFSQMRREVHKCVCVRVCEA